MSEKHNHDCCSSTDTVVNHFTDNKLANKTISNFHVTGMDCADEIEAIQKALVSPKIAGVSANLMSSQVTVEHDPSLEKNDIVTMINSAGVRVREEASNLTFFQDNKVRIALVGISATFLSLGLVLQYVMDTSQPFLFTSYLIATIAGGALIIPKAVRAIKQKSLDMNVLMVIAAIGAFIIDEYSEGAAVVFLFSLAEMLEAFSVARARKAIREVLSIVPDFANLVDGDDLKQVPVSDIKIGETILIRAGDRIPLDGTITSGSSYVNQSPLTGESEPIAKNVGDVVLAGTINESSNLKAKITHDYKDTKIANVIKMVEEAQSKKAPAQLFVDKFAKIYTPIVTFIAALVCLVPPLLFNQPWDVWMYRSLVFLVIACPCALVIATPVSVVSALTALAKNGVLVKGGVFLESLGKLRALAVDKTGTITEGTPKVASVKVWKQDSDTEFFEVSLSLERPSTHPLAKAVTKFLGEKRVKGADALEYQVVPGKGVTGVVGTHLYFAGNHRFAHELGVCSPELETYLKSLEEEAQSVMIVGHKPHNNCKGEVLGVFGLADSPRMGVKNAIASLHGAGIQEVVMLSGDNQHTVNAIAKNVGIDTARGDLLPENKVTELNQLLRKHNYVGMIGDGINDAPALAQATVGIAMGAAGTDTAIETADIALMTDDINQLAKAIRIGRKSVAIIRFNIGFALATKAVFLVLGSVGYSSLWLAVAADMGATLLVIANSLRLLKVKDGI